MACHRCGSCRFLGAPRTTERVIAPAGLLAWRVAALPAFPVSQWHIGIAIRLQLRGQPRLVPCSLFTDGTPPEPERCLNGRDGPKRQAGPMPQPPREAAVLHNRQRLAQVQHELQFA